MDVVGHQRPSVAACRGFLQKIPHAVQETMVILPVFEYGLALDPSYRDMVKCTWCLSAIGFASGEPGGPARQCLLPFPEHKLALSQLGLSVHGYV